MRLIAGLVIAVALGAQTPDARFDPGLAAFAPPDTVMITGVQMDALRATPVYARMMSTALFNEFDDFKRRTGIDLRRDVRQLLIALNGTDFLVIARGAFQITMPLGVRRSVYKGASFHESDGFGLALIDPTLVIIGPSARMRQAIDHRVARGAQPPLILHSRSIPGSAQIWLVGKAFPRVPLGQGGETPSGMRLIHMFRTIGETSMWVDLRSGVIAKLTGTCQSEEEAKKLRDTVRGFIGLARLSVPEKQPEMLRFYDGFRAEQRGTVVDVDIKAPAELLDAFLKFAGPGKR